MKHICFVHEKFVSLRAYIFLNLIRRHPFRLIKRESREIIHRLWFHLQIANLSIWQHGTDVSRAFTASCLPCAFSLYIQHKGFSSVLQEICNYVFMCSFSDDMYMSRGEWGWRTSASLFYATYIRVWIQLRFVDLITNTLWIGL